MTFSSSLYHAWQLLLAKFFDLLKLESWPPGPPEPTALGVRGQIWIAYSVLRYMKVKPYQFGLANICKRFLRTLKHSGFTNKPKSTRKYLFDRPGFWGLEWTTPFKLNDIKIFHSGTLFLTYETSIIKFLYWYLGRNQDFKYFWCEFVRRVSFQI